MPPDQDTLFPLISESKALWERILLESGSDENYRRVRRILNCASFSALLHNGKNYEIVPMYCHSRWCERCAVEKSLSMARNLAIQFASQPIKSPNRIRYESLRHFVFTIKSIHYCKLSKLIPKYQHFIRRLTKFFQSENRFYLWKIEIKFHYETCHPHIHVAVNSYYDVSYLHKLFRKHIKPFISTIKFGKKAECTLYEFTKYTTKPSEWKDINPKHFHFIFDSFQNRRVIGVSQHFKLMPKNEPLGWEYIGCFEKILCNKHSDFYGVAWSLYNKIKEKEKTGIRGKKTT